MSRDAGRGAGMRRKTPEELLDYGLDWIAANRGTYNRVMHLCLCEVEAGEDWVGRDYIYRMAKKSRLRITNDKEFRFSHELWSVIARYMAMMRPVLARVISCNRSPIDDFDFEQKWHDRVGDGTVFLARSYAEAKRMCEEGDPLARVLPPRNRKDSKCKRPTKGELCRAAQQSLFQQ
ncbi:hypothetical protein [Adlercreutzia caecimuris]|uniref:Uncharacterized protein n=1 Tax=Adlercreutzia caecimuris TaxID=671266 RepID=A0A4S4G2Y0_9ACTN|nr:hypothetical protein [Adlercreutzia caecimuris]THG36872.1 hypothetical protein E5986_08195 [Adlercreutzia caecimuris]